MDERPTITPQQAREASGDELSLLLHDEREEVLSALLDNPNLQEVQVCLLLGRKELPLTLLEKIAQRQDWMMSYRVRRNLALHPHVGQTVGMQLVRHLFAVDLVELALSPSGSSPLRHLAEELLLARVAQLPTAQKMHLARRGSSRIAAALLAEASSDLLGIVLENPFLNEGQVLKVLSRISLPERVVRAIAEHSRWSNIYSIRLMLLKNSKTPLARVLVFLPAIAMSDLQSLSRASAIPTAFMPHVRRAIASRAQGRSQGLP
jgi:hypothetical protein